MLTRGAADRCEGRERIAIMAELAYADQPVSRDRHRPVLAALAGTLLGGCGQVLDPAGPVSAQLQSILLNSVVIMLAIVVPTILAVLLFAWWFRAGNPRARRQPEFVYSGKVEMVTWSIPLLTIMFLGGISWIGSHTLDPAKPLPGSEAPLEVEVVALDWKWLFNYPEQHVASVNRLLVPVGRPLRLHLTSASVMNSFFVPRLGSMIYAMNGMVSELNLRADVPGTFPGMASHFNGDGFSDMHFEVQAVSPAAFSDWTNTAHLQGGELTRTEFEELTRQGGDVPPIVYGQVESGLFNALVRQEIPPGSGPVLYASGRENRP